MQKLKFILSLSLLILFFNPGVKAEDKAGIELGWAYLPGFEDEVVDTAQALANALGETVSYSTDTGAPILRGYYRTDINNNGAVELGGFLSLTDVETVFSIPGASITIAQEIMGFDLSYIHEAADGVGIKLGLHMSDVDSESTVALGGQSAAVTASDSGSGLLIGILSTDGSSQVNYGLTYYDALGGVDDSDATFLSFSYQF